MTQNLSITSLAHQAVRAKPWTPGHEGGAAIQKGWQDSCVVREDALEGLESAIAALTALHPRCAEVLQLRFFAKMSIEQTARELGIATGTVKRDFVFARAFLAARLSDHTR